MALAHAGLLKQHPAIVSTFVTAELEPKEQSSSMRVSSMMAILVTAGGITASFDLGLRLVERFWGAEKWRAVAKLLRV